ncbi:hypothetical protein M0Q97_13695 [Candidatus Dojkabacteria bacterium]|jgi:hypothetical protein|nr:hypothetical protein [Candidatus Dojkabacteria bacterium]
MNSIIIISIIWCLLGVIGWFFTYHTIRKNWYYEFDEDLWKTKYKTVLIVICICFPLWVICGLWTTIYWLLCYDKKYWSLYFKIKK